MGKQQKLIKGLPLLALMMFGALSIMATGCGGDNAGDGTAITQQTLVATWDIAASHSQITQSGTILLSDNGELTYNLVQLNLNQPGLKPMILIGTGTWTFNESSLTLTFDTGVVYEAIAQGDSTNFSMACSNGWTLNFSRI